jgi:hypothetical protein
VDKKQSDHKGIIIIIGKLESYAFFKVRLAFVGYRDFFGPWDTVTSFKQFEMLDFTDSVDAFHQFCGNLTASGGDDSPEDVFGGLEKAIALNWSTDG